MVQQAQMKTEQFEKNRKLEDQSFVASAIFGLSISKRKLSKKIVPPSKRVVRFSASSKK